MPPLAPAVWTVVVPVKGGPAAKSRLHPPQGVSRWELAYAIAEDCLSALRQDPAVAHVVVVSGDEAVIDLADQLDLTPVADPDQGLDAAAAVGIAHSPTASVAVLLGDLPSLQPGDVAAALAAVTGPAVVPDREGTGTVLLAHPDGGSGMTTRFGPGSAAAHERAGYARLELDLPRLRTDVDDDASLALAVALGVGPATRAVLDGSAADDRSA